MSNIQHFDWGFVEWIYEPDDTDSFNVMSIGIYTIFPGKRQKRHIHYGDEQLLYVLSGHGDQIIDDKSSFKDPGDIFHIEAGSVHETVNTGEEVLKELVISIPANYDNRFLKNIKSLEKPGKRLKLGSLAEIKDEIAVMCEEFTRSIKIPVSIFDSRGDVIVVGKAFPDVCVEKCHIDCDLKNCCLYDEKDTMSRSGYRDPTAFMCPFGLSVFSMPLIYHEHLLGYIKGGHIRGPLDDKDLDTSLPFFSKASVQAVIVQIKKLDMHIIDRYRQKNAQKELDKRKETIRNISRHETILEESLKSTKEKMLNIQINNHFLFNTFNALASLAIKEDAILTYRSIIDLSLMFKYTRNSEDQMISLRDEIDYLNKYIDLQKLRFGERLKSAVSFFEDKDDIRLPFNCLQPIIENSFIHAFGKMDTMMTILVSGKTEGGRLMIEVVDNGEGMDETTLMLLDKKIRGDHKTGQMSGLMMIYSKLESIYGKDFSFELFSQKNSGTRVLIDVPIKRTEGQLSKEQ